MLVVRARSGARIDLLLCAALPLMSDDKLTVRHRRRPARRPPVRPSARQLSLEYSLLVPTFLSARLCAPWRRGGFAGDLRPPALLGQALCHCSAATAIRTALKPQRPRLPAQRSRARAWERTQPESTAVRGPARHRHGTARREATVEMSTVRSSVDSVGTVGANEDSLVPSCTTEHTLCSRL